MATIASMSVGLSVNHMKFTAGLMKAESAVAVFRSRVEDSVSGSMASFAKLGTAVGGIGAALGAVGAVKWGVEVASAAEQSQVAFEVMLGSAEQATSLLKDLRDMAAATPFSQQSITTAAQQLKTYGVAVKDIIPILTILGDAAAASPSGMEDGLQSMIRAMGQMHAKGKASAEELQQLAEKGVGAWQFLADKMGVTVAEVQQRVSAGQVTAAEAIGATLEGMQTKFSGMMDKQSRTLAGLWSSLKDNAGNALGSFADQMMKDLDVKGGLSQMSAWFADAENSARGLAQNISAVVKPALEVSTAVKDLSIYLGDTAITSLRDNLGGAFGFATDQTRSWRAATIDFAETAAQGVGLVIEQVTQLFKDVEASWGKLSRLIEGDVMQIAQLPIFRHSIAMGIGEGFIGQQIRNQIRPDLEPEAERWGEEGGIASMQNRIRGMFAEFRQNDAVREANKQFRQTLDIWLEMQRVLQGWQNPKIDVAALDIVSDLRKAFGVGDIIGHVMELQATVANAATQLRESALDRLEGVAVSELGKGRDAPQSPQALLRGSAEAYSMAIQRDIHGSAEERMAEAVRKAVQKMEEEVKLSREIRDLLKKQQVPVPVKL